MFHFIGLFGAHFVLISLVFVLFVSCGVGLFCFSDFFFFNKESWVGREMGRI